MVDDSLETVTRSNSHSGLTPLLEMYFHEHGQERHLSEIMATIKHCQRDRECDEASAVVSILGDWAMFQQMSDVLHIPPADVFGDREYDDGSGVVRSKLGARRYVIRMPDGKVYSQDGKVLEFYTVIFAVIKMLELGIGPAVCKKPCEMILRHRPIDWSQVTQK